MAHFLHKLRLYTAGNSYRVINVSITTEFCTSIASNDMRSPLCFHADHGLSSRNAVHRGRIWSFLWEMNAVQKTVQIQYVFSPAQVTDSQKVNAGRTWWNTARLKSTWCRVLNVGLGRSASGSLVRQSQSWKLSKDTDTAPLEKAYCHLS